MKFTTFSRKKSINTLSLFFFLIILTLMLIFTTGGNTDQSGKSNDFNVIGADGLVIEVDYTNFFKIMKRMDYAIVFLFNPKLCRVGIECKDILNEFKKASEKLFKNTPAVGLFKLRCNFRLENNKSEKSSDLCEELNIEEESIPQLLFIYHGSYAFMDKSKPITHHNIVEFMLSKIYISSISSLNNKRDIKVFFENEKSIDSKMRLNSMKFLFYSNKKFINQQLDGLYKNNSSIDFNRIDRNSTHLESLFIDSALFNSFKAFKISNKRTLLYFINYVKENSHYIINEFEKIRENLEDFIENKENEDLIITFNIPEEVLNDENFQALKKDKELKRINIFPLQLNYLKKSN